MGQIVFAATPAGGASGAQQISRVDADGTHLAQLTTAKGNAVPTDINDFPATSPDGKTIVFGSGRDFQPQVNPMLRMLYLMAADGSNQRRLTGNSPGHCVEQLGSFSSDGAWIVFEMSCDQSIDPTTSNLEKLYRIHPDGTGQEKLAPNDPLVTSQSNQSDPVFTPDGAAVLFVSDASPTTAEIFKLDLKTQKIVQLTHAGDAGRTVRFRTPMVSPAGDVVYFVSTPSDFSPGASVDKVKIDGTGAMKVRSIGSDPGNGADKEDFFALSPKGDAFVYVTLLKSSPQSTYALSISALDGSGEKMLDSGRAFYGWGSPSWR